MKHVSTIRGVGAAALIAIAALSGCATGGKQPAPPVTASAVDAQSVEARAKQRWDLLITGKAADAWDYLSPGYRTTVDRQRYGDDMRNRPTRWLSAAVDRVECEDESTCKVVVKVDIEAVVPGRSGGVMTTGWVTENWLRIDGAWYLVP